jgi:hypothetical protein
MIGFIASYTLTQLGTTSNYSLQFTVIHALVFSVFTSRILATVLSQSHCNFKSHIKSSFHRLIPSCHYSAAASSEDSTLHFSTTLLYSSSEFLCTFINPRSRTPRKTPSSTVKEVCLLVLYLAMKTFYCRVCVCCGNVFTDPLPSNGYIRQ